MSGVPDEKAAERSYDIVVAFLKKIGMYRKLSEVGMPESEIVDLAKQSMVLPDYKGNPRIATYEEMVELVRESF
jgi:alcohol dehydrogenase class IV